LGKYAQSRQAAYFPKGVNPIRPPPLRHRQSECDPECHPCDGPDGKRGTGFLASPGKPKTAMGGREVGGLANMLANHLELGKCLAHRDAVRHFWGEPHICTRPGLKAVDMFQALRRWRIKARVGSSLDQPWPCPLPDADGVAAADLRMSRFCPSRSDHHGKDRQRNDRWPMSSTCTRDGGEKDGTVTNSERRGFRASAALSPGTRAVRP